MELHLDIPTHDWLPIWHLLEISFSTDESESDFNVCVFSMTNVKRKFKHSVQSNFYFFVVNMFTTWPLHFCCCKTLCYSSNFQCNALHQISFSFPLVFWHVSSHHFTELLSRIEMCYVIKRKLQAKLMLRFCANENCWIICKK